MLTRTPVIAIRMTRARAAHQRHFVSLMILVGAFVLAVSGCKIAETHPEVPELDIAEQMKMVGLGEGDVVDIRVYNEKQLSGAHRVSPQGSINFPLIGKVSVDGLTAGQIADLISQRLENGFLKTAHVSVFVKEHSSKRVYVVGQVKKPGTFKYRTGLNIVEVVTLAQGFSGAANANYVVVTRRQNGKDVRYPVNVAAIQEGEAPNFILHAGDIVFVPDRLL